MDLVTYQLLNSQSIIRNPGKVESLSQTCRKLIRRLVLVPNFKPRQDSMMMNELECRVSVVHGLWDFFKRGDSLLAIYNASSPEEGDLIVAVETPKDKIAETAVLLFITACMQSTNIPVADIFTLSDLYGSHMAGFVKVVKTVVDLLASRGYPIISESNDTVDLREEKMTKREYIISDLVESERQYVHHVVDILYLKNELKRTLSEDSLHSIFMNIDNLANFALRFLVRIEELYYLEDEMQNFGDLFVHFKEFFKHYGFFIANQRKCQETCRKEWGVMVSTMRNTTLGQRVLAHPKFLLELLLKPLQRLFKYPMLLKDLMNETLDIEMRADLAAAIKIFENILQHANANIDHEALRAATQGFIDGTVHMEAGQHVVVPRDADASSISDSLRPVSMDDIPPPPYFLAHRPDSLAEMRGSHF